MAKTYEAEILEHTSPGVARVKVGGKETTAAIPVNLSVRPEKGSKIDVSECARHGFVFSAPAKK